MSEGQRLYFEARDVSKEADFVAPSQLKVGEVYFRVAFVDRQSRIPLLRPVMFAGRNLDGSSDGQLFFQDVESYEHGVRFGDASSAVFEMSVEAEGSGVFDFDEALNCLLRCSLLNAYRRSDSC